MEVYFAQHGRAMSKDQDPDRPLTDEGRSETRQVARTAAAAGLEVDAVWHSGKLRARQTAEIFAEALEPPEGVVARDDLGATADPAGAVEACRASGLTVLLVGHKPFMSRLPALLLVDQPDREILDVRYSGLGALGEDDEGWTLRWYLPPELA